MWSILWPRLTRTYFFHSIFCCAALLFWIDRLPTCCCCQGGTQKSTTLSVFVCLGFGVGQKMTLLKYSHRFVVASVLAISYVESLRDIGGHLSFSEQFRVTTVRVGCWLEDLEQPSWSTKLWSTTYLRVKRRKTTSDYLISQWETVFQVAPQSQHLHPYVIIGRRSQTWRFDLQLTATFLLSNL
jgi:hypothetical protein